jgi:hypothetical protein
MSQIHDRALGTRDKGVVREAGSFMATGKLGEMIQKMSFLLLLFLLLLPASSVLSAGTLRTLTFFHLSDECARIIVNAAELGKREEIMTPIGKIGVLLQPFIPSILDVIAIKKSKNAIKFTSPPERG